VVRFALTIYPYSLGLSFSTTFWTSTRRDFRTYSFEIANNIAFSVLMRPIDGKPPKIIGHTNIGTRFYKYFRHFDLAPCRPMQCSVTRLMFSEIVPRPFAQEISHHFCVSPTRCPENG